MLLDLNISNFAIIDDLNIRFTKGLNILTGETGAGKSIIIEALGIILGGRGTKELIQDGKDKAILEASFIVNGIDDLVKYLEELGIDIDEDGLLIITREISLTHPSISRVNGRTVTLSILREISTKIIDIFAQQEHQSLLDVSNHIRLVDSFGDNELKIIKSNIEAKYNELEDLKNQLKEIDIDPLKREREIELIKFQIDEIESAQLSKKDDKEIEEEYNKVNNIKDITKNVAMGINLLNSSDFNEPSIIDMLNEVISLVNNVLKYDKELNQPVDRLKDINYELQDISGDLERYIDVIDIDEERLNFLYERINLVNGLKKKYGNTIDEIFNYRDKIQKDLDMLQNHDKKIKEINCKIDKLNDELLALANKLTIKRKEVSKFLEVHISEELLDLRMKNIKFKINFKKKKNIAEDGIDNIEFMISTNLGESLKPLSRIVSGGEMSRIMLGFKSILADHDGIPTMIFDEIDTGISGRTAQVVGEKIKRISRNHQVIAITHLPQIAAMADSHYLISKDEENNRVITNIKKLNNDERVDEMARLLGGVDLTETTRKHAKEMLEMSRGLK